ncbi:MAG: Trk system potassium transporter TrkA, partial [Muribaculaceae bacterium]|nr:Trk system potassium transporter TrkA [Muribaculaceae bacterium]
HIFKLLLDADEENAKCLALADAEVAEMQVKKGAKITKAPVKDLHLPFGMTLAGMVRDNECRLVSGNTQIEAGDFVVVFCLSGTINKIEKWFN